jgi:hypothetical protein
MKEGRGLPGTLRIGDKVRVYLRPHTIAPGQTAMSATPTGVVCEATVIFQDLADPLNPYLLGWIDDSDMPFTARNRISDPAYVAAAQNANNPRHSQIDRYTFSLWLWHENIILADFGSGAPTSGPTCIKCHNSFPYAAGGPNWVCTGCKMVWDRLT